MISHFCVLPKTDCRERGRSQHYIDRYRAKRMKEQRMSAEEGKPNIIWSSHDHSFEKKDGEVKRMLTVAEYYERIYGIRLKYPNMPIVSVNRKGYFPVEFLYQETGRVPGANDGDKVKEVLKYHDQFAGMARMQHVQQVRQIASDRSKLTDLLRQFSVSVNREPVNMNATRLRAPPLEFGNNDVEENTSSGSWNLHRKRFKKYVFLVSVLLPVHCLSLELAVGSLANFFMLMSYFLFFVIALDVTVFVG